jgi:pilus assembly protein CpaB
MLRLLIFFVALVAAGLAAWLAMSMQSGKAPVVAQVPEAPINEVLVASLDLEQGQKLSEENMRWQAWPDEASNSAFISRTAHADALQALKGSIVRSHIVSGEPIREDKLARAGSGFLSVILASGKRAVGVRVTAENTAGGFILPSDRVDVIHTTTRQPQGGGQPESVSRTILTNIPVLAIDQTADETKTEAVVIGKTATLELDSRQVEIITAAAASGTLSLALRSVADSAERQIVTWQGANRKSSSAVRMIHGGVSELVKLP